MRTVTQESELTPDQVETIITDEPGAVEFLSQELAMSLPNTRLALQQHAPIAREANRLAKRILAGNFRRAA